VQHANAEIGRLTAGRQRPKFGRCPWTAKFPSRPPQPGHHVPRRMIGRLQGEIAFRPAPDGYDDVDNDLLGPSGVAIMQRTTLGQTLR
jgi:hypothetical protein